MLKEEKVGSSHFLVDDGFIRAVGSCKNRVKFGKFDVFGDKEGGEVGG